MTYCNGYSNPLPPSVMPPCADGILVF